MLVIVDNKSFRKDIKRLRKRGKDMEKLSRVVEMLVNQQPLPAKCRPHRLTGNWEGCWDCHIEPDWLLLYQLTPTELFLVRTGSHTDLFD